MSLAMAEASQLAAILSAQQAAVGNNAAAAAASGTVGGGVGAGGSVTQKAEGFQRAVKKALQQFDAQHGPEVGETYGSCSTVQPQYGSVAAIHAGSVCVMLA
jgi:hypothetical protein